MQLIYRAGDITEAHIVAGMLRAHGLECHVGGHYLQGGIGDMAVQDFAVVHVADEDVAAAKELIAQYESDDQPLEPEHSSAEAGEEAVATSFLHKPITALVVLVCVLLAFFLFKV
jgi:hypothetical protein